MLLAICICLVCVRRRRRRRASKVAVPAGTPSLTHSTASSPSSAGSHAGDSSAFFWLGSTAARASGGVAAKDLANHVDGMSTLQAAAGGRFEARSAPVRPDFAWPSAFAKGDGRGTGPPAELAKTRHFASAANAFNEFEERGARANEPTPRLGAAQGADPCRLPPQQHGHLPHTTNALSLAQLDPLPCQDSGQAGTAAQSRGASGGGGGIPHNGALRSINATGVSASSAAFDTLDGALIEGSFPGSSDLDLSGIGEGGLAMAVERSSLSDSAADVMQRSSVGTAAQHGAVPAQSSAEPAVRRSASDGAAAALAELQREMRAALPQDRVALSALLSDKPAYRMCEGVLRCFRNPKLRHQLCL